MLINKNKGLYFFALFNVSNIFFARAENKNKINVEYNLSIKHNGVNFYLPYYIKIKNNSNNPINLNKDLITAPLLSAKEAARSIRNFYKLKFIVSSILAVVSGYLTSSMSKSMKSLKSLPNVAYNPKPNANIKDKIVIVDKTSFWAKLNLITASICSISSLVLIGKLFTENESKLEDSLSKELLDDKYIVINPGQEVEKIFWLKNNKDSFSINYKAIQTS